MAGKKNSIGLTGTARALLLGATVAVSSLAGVHSASATTHKAHHPAVHKVSTHKVSHKKAVVSLNTHYSHAALHQGEAHYQTVSYSGHGLQLNDGVYHVHHRHLRSARYQHSGLQCVPYAREVSHIDLSGNAYLWWAEAAGRYARGNAPAEGAVLNFRAIGRMPLGHVAVVTSVVDSRTILVTQANWVRGTITNDVTMQDVSPNNDWSQVQVELGDSSTWGAAYPTYGFIYNQPADATVIAANGQGNEVAEAPVAQPVAAEAPDRNLQ